MKILVTGAAGFIGAFTSKKLIEMGHRVIGIDNLNSYYEVKLKHDRLSWLSRLDGFEFIEHLRQNPDWKSIPTVVLTAKELTAQDRQLLSGSVESIIQKGSYTGEELLKEVRTADI